MIPKSRLSRVGIKESPDKVMAHRTNIHNVVDLPVIHRQARNVKWLGFETRIIMLRGVVAKL